MTANRLPRAASATLPPMGYSGHGTHMATLMGTLMAEIMDGRADLNPWQGFDWPAIPAFRQTVVPAVRRRLVSTEGHLQ